jgi:hypothetical protein
MSKEESSSEESMSLKSRTLAGMIAAQSVDKQQLEMRLFFGWRVQVQQLNFAANHNVQQPQPQLQGQVPNNILFIYTYRDI